MKKPAAKARPSASAIPAKMAAGILLAAFSAGCGSRTETPAPSKIEYVIFESGGPDQGPGPDMNVNLPALKSEFGSADPKSTRMVGYGVQQIRILSRSVPFVAAEIQRILDAAEQSGIPVWLHLDPLFAWGADLESKPEDAPAIKFWNDPEMREWKEFPVAGKLPDDIPRFWFNWGPWCSPVSAVPAIGSPKFVDFARRQLREGVLAPLQARLKKWKKEGREHLFAGINVGWEIYLPYYHEGWLVCSNGGKGGPVFAQCPKAIRGLQMDGGIVGSQLGYASLHWQGWDEAKLREAAGKEGIPRDEKFRQLCFQAIHDYLQALAEECHRAGIGPDKVFTHIVALATVNKADTNMPPIWTAVNPYSTPGFTMDNKGGAKYNLAVLKEQLANAPGSRGKMFGAVETYFGLNGKNYVTDEGGYRAELDDLFGNGARVVVVLAAFPFSAASPQTAFSAIRKWSEEGVSQSDWEQKK